MVRPSTADLLNLDRALVPEERKRLCAGTTLKGDEALPGSGSEGETYGWSKQLVPKRLARTDPKCGLTERGWTEGAGSNASAGCATLQAERGADVLALRTTRGEWPVGEGCLDLGRRSEPALQHRPAARRS